MDSYRRQQIEAKAQDMLNDAGVVSLPINPMEIAKHLDIQVHAKPPIASGASGWLLRQGNDFAIIYATHIESPGFQNFSVAHELGHFCLDGHPEYIFKQGSEHASRGGFGSPDPIEREADYFASCLMMPKSLCKPIINKNGDGMAAVRSLAETCNTSLTAAALRYAEIGHLPTGVLQCLNGRVEFCAIYPLQSHVGWAKPLGRNMKVPSDSATQRLADDPDAIRAAMEDSDSAEASDWFFGAKSGVYLTEEAIGLGSYGRTLTLLTLEEEEQSEEENN
ncbi:ImmA/IrrE family metallo-endopeptidase [Stenotrophomonas maltophilia]